MITYARSLPGIEQVLDRATVCQRYQLPPDREGDFTIFADRRPAVAARCQDHDLSALGDHRLRPHGGLGKHRGQFLFSSPLTRPVDTREWKGVFTRCRAWRCD